MSNKKVFLRSNTINSTIKYSNKKLKNNNINTNNNVNKKRIDDLIFNLSEDIRQYQQYLKILGPHHKNVEALNEKILTQLSDNNHEIIQFILNKKKRTNEELIIIKTFLSTMKYLSSMISIIDTDKILFSLSVYLKMERKNKDSVLFRYGNKGTKFYILLSGQVTILLLKETKVQITFLRYIQHLFLLKMMKEDELVKKTIVANYKNKYHLDERTFDMFYDKIVKYQKNHNKNKKNEELNELEFEEESNEESEIISERGGKNKKDKDLGPKKTLQLNYLCSNFNERLNSKNYKIDEDDFKLEDKSIIDDKRRSVGLLTPSRPSLLQPTKLPSYHNLNSSNIGSPLFNKDDEVKKLLSFYMHLKEALHNFKRIKISVSDYIRDTYIDSNYCKVIKEDPDNKKEQYIIYLYYEIVQKNKGDTFGELALQHEDSKRTATILTNTDCILGYLSKNDYETCLSEIELKRRKNEVNFIMSFSIFDQMNWISFENKYFNYFKREYYYQGEKILKQGMPINKIYFIMDGQFEITSSLSIANLYKIIRQKTNYSFQKMKIRLRNKLNNIRLCICYNKDILGLNDCCFYRSTGEVTSFIDATCISSKSIAFTLDKSILGELQNKMSEIKENIKQIINKRDKVMLDRLISIFNQLIKNRELNIENKKLKTERKDLIKENNCYLLNNERINYILKGNKNEEDYSPYKNVLLSAKYREKRPKSKDTRNKPIKTLENQNNFLNANLTQGRRLFSSSYKNKNINNINSIDFKNDNQTVNDTDNIEYKKKITNIMAIKDSMPKKKNPRIYLKSAVSIRDLNEKKNVKSKMKNLYSPLNNIIHKEYNNLFTWVDCTKKNSETQKMINYEQNEYIMDKDERKESEFGNDSKRLSFSSEDKNDDKDIKKQSYNTEENKTKYNKINKKNKNMKIRRTLKFLVLEEEIRMKNNIKKLKNKKISSNNKYSNKTINNNNNNIKEHYNKVDILKNPFNLSNSKNNKKFNSLSNEIYLKQILGTKYKNEEDKYISRTEKKLIKEINEYNLELKRRKEAKLKFLKKNRKLKKNSFMNLNDRYYLKSENNKESSNDLLLSKNFNINKLKKSYEEKYVSNIFKY